MFIEAMAERVGFEPTIRYNRIPDFESGAFDHSAISPEKCDFNINIEKHRTLKTLGARNVSLNTPSTALHSRLPNYTFFLTSAALPHRDVQFNTTANTIKTAGNKSILKITKTKIGDSGTTAEAAFVKYPVQF